MSKNSSPRVVRPKRPPGVLICGKCVRKADDGRAIRKALKTALAAAADAAGGRPAKLVETRCLGVCPKRAVMLGSGATLARGELVMVARPADVPAALDALRPAPTPTGGPHG